MKTIHAIAFLLSLTTYFAVVPTQASAQDWTWPEKPADLQVLPKDWPGSRLRPVMTGFTRALGVRCSHCHVGEEGQPLSKYDFASNANPNKDRARTMLNMLGDINESLGEIEPSGEKRVNMWCHTCHRGRPRPMTLSEELAEVYRADSYKGAIRRYHELKDQFYGKGAYSFSERELNSFGYGLLRAQDHEGAIAIFQLYTSEFPDSANAWDSLGEGYMEAGDTQQAITSYQKSLKLDPENENAGRKLEELKTLAAARD